MLDVEKARVLLTKRIAACRGRGFLPAALIDLIESIYGAQLEARGAASVPPAGTIETTDALRHGQGAPLLPRSGFPYDKEQTTALFHRFLEMTAACGLALAGPAQAVASALADGSLDLDRAMQAHLDGDEAFFSTWAERTAPAPRLLPMLVQAALTPSLERVAQELRAKTDLAGTWNHGHCPVCGSMPIMSDLREKEGFRYNICGFCHAEYHVPRLQCPFCLEKDMARLEHYEAKEEPGVRINACKTCNMYIKQTDFRNLDRAALPLIDDLESLSMDVVARDKKLKRPTLSAWGF